MFYTNQPALVYELYSTAGDRGHPIGTDIN